MSIVDDIFSNSNFITNGELDDKSYHFAVEKADEYRKAVEKLLDDTNVLDLFLDALEECNQIEKKYIFADGVRFAMGVKGIMKDC